ncbi:MAG: hypothetical protein HOK52_00030 [Candidatus Marinimicrobia bacterium]|nr:hypothetical protein [Candidatus Neomarinimicrobiota bacterium]MBT5758451.1 hypothetical protein [Candidatus Neomarinimicrobiota bacterium]MBT6469629.1 hypothetical protein [Candidatus Neomarinimicrobiota bacterium]
MSFDINKDRTDELIAKVMKQFGFRHQYEVAEYFGITAQTLSGWVKSGIVPDKYIMKFQLDVQEMISPREIASDDRIKSNFSNGFPEDVPNNHHSREFSFTILFANHLKPLMLFPIFISVFVAVWVFFIALPVYTSSAKVLPIGDKGSSFSDMAGMASQLGLSIPMNLGNEIPWDEMFPEIVQSENLKIAILGQNFSSNKYENDQSLFYIVEREFNLEDEPDNIRDKMVVDKLNDLINVSKSRLSPIVTINVNFFEPQLAADILSAVIEESGQIQIKLKSKKISEKRQFIEERIVEVMTALRNAEVALKDFKESNRRPDRSPSLKLVESRLEREVSLQNSLYVTLKSQFENVKIEEVEESAMIQVVDGPIVPFRLTKPKRLMSILFSLIISFIGLFFIFYLKDYTISGNEKESEVRKEARTKLINNMKTLLPFVPKSGR